MTMRQGEKEGDSSYLKRFKINLETLYTAGGRHLLCSKDIMEAVDKDDPTYEEVEQEESKFKAIVYMKRGDKVRYEALTQEFQNAAHLGYDRYPVSVTEAYDVMVRRSGAFNTNLHSNNRTPG